MVELIVKNGTLNTESDDSMFDNIENLKILNASTGISKAHTTITNRKTHVFNFRLNGEVHLDFPDKRLTAKMGEMLFLPQGISYDFHSWPENESRFMTVSFQANIHNPSPAVYSLESFPEAEYFCSHFPDMWKFGNQAERYHLYSLFYGLLSYLSNIEHTKYSDRKKFKIIEPAVVYLRSHIYDSNLRADKLHLMCGISNTYFRSIFASNFGTSPQQYIVSKRIAHAKSVIDSGDFDTISEVAASVGYNDPLYFSRAFKKKYGISPSNAKEI